MFQGGYISLGKLAKEMGMSVWNIRKWLEEHDIPQNNSFLEDDVKNARKNWVFDTVALSKFLNGKGIY